MMKAIVGVCALMVMHVSSASAQVELFPKNGAVDVNPDIQLRLSFGTAPALNNRGKIRIHDAADDSVVDELDMSIPPGPRNTRTPAPYDTFKYASVPDTVFTVNSPDTDKSHIYQSNNVGGTGETSARHFYPVLIEGNTATIHPHNNRLHYGKTYYVQVDAEVFTDLPGITGKSAWSFSTRSAGPAADAERLVVAADGTGDFSTVQGAIDFVPDGNTRAREIFIARGVYDEIVVVRNKHNLTLHGEDRDGVVVRYANNGVFNSTGRYEFALSGSNEIHLINFTIQSVGKDETPSQAEALYVKGDKLQVHAVSMLGSGDALQIQAGTRLFLSGSKVRGYGDNFLSYGAAFFRNCQLVSTYGPHGWPRNPQTNHGDVFVNSTFSLEGKGTSGDGHCTLARSPDSGASFPYAEFVLLDCKLQGIAPEGWGAAAPDTSNVHFWEYNSVNLSDGQPVDVSKRAAYSRQLTMEKDAETIANYRDPGYVLGGWTPELAPVVLSKLPETLTLAPGDDAELHAEAAAEPEPTYQWSKDGVPLMGETGSTLKLTAAMAGEYSVTIRNRIGMLTGKTTLIVGPAGAQPSAASAAAGTGGLAVAPQAGSAAGGVSGGVTAPPTRAGTSGAPAASATVPAAGARAMAGSPSTALAGAGSPEPPRAAGGCHVGAEPRPSGDVWPWLLVAWVVTRRRRTNIVAHGAPDLGPVKH